MHPPWPSLLPSLLLLLPSLNGAQSKSLIDCFNGFVGEIQSSLHDGYFPMNDTRMCAAEWCMKVLVHSAIDSDGFARRGVSSRCAYTGGDRQLCFAAAERGGEACTRVHHYDAMQGNFTLCCCRTNYCNHYLPQDLVFGEDGDVVVPAKQRRDSADINSARSVPHSLLLPAIVLAIII